MSALTSICVTPVGNGTARVTLLPCLPFSPSHSWLIKQQVKQTICALRYVFIVVAQIKAAFYTRGTGFMFVGFSNVAYWQDAIAGALL